MSMLEIAGGIVLGALALPVAGFVMGCAVALIIRVYRFIRYRIFGNWFKGW